MGLSKKSVEKKCDVSGCGKEAERSINVKKLEGVLSVGVGQRDRQAHLCKEHYREFKKKTKKERELDRLAWS